jgi:phosphopantothenoylcysteine synthetase/decarboxylase
MKILVTAGNTQVPIDRVRCITNIFTGRTGTTIALHAHARGHAVTLLTSHVQVVAELQAAAPPADHWQVWSYRTFEMLEAGLEAALRGDAPDVVIHCAAVSDYRAAGIFAPAPHTHFQAESGQWQGNPPMLLDCSAAKVKSDEPELWLRLTRYPKLIDRIRTDWAFTGTLVKFKLEAGIREDQLLEIAERSRRQSAADLMVANTVEGAGAWAYLGPFQGEYRRIPRDELAARLLDAVEHLRGSQTHG